MLLKAWLHAKVGNVRGTLASHQTCNPVASDIQTLLPLPAYITSVRFIYNFFVLNLSVTNPLTHGVVPCTACVSTVRIAIRPQNVNMRIV
jgi:hypothetical protein